MKTINVVSSTGIQGNVGSCTTNSVMVTVNGGYFRDEGYYVLTNSCNGEVQHTPFTSWAFPGVITVIIALIVGMVVLVALAE